MTSTLPKRSLCAGRCSTRCICHQRAVLSPDVCPPPPAYNRLVIGSRTDHGTRTEHRMDFETGRSNALHSTRDAAVGPAPRAWAFSVQHEQRSQGSSLRCSEIGQGICPGHHAAATRCVDEIEIHHCSSTDPSSRRGASFEEAPR